MSTATARKPKANASESLTEFFAGIGTSERTKVDKEKSIVHGVKLLGLESKNGRSYLPAGVRNAISLYEGAKINVNHPKGNPTAPRDFEDRLGEARNVTFVEGEGLFGDVHYNPENRAAKQFVYAAEHMPSGGGFSHNIEGRTTKRDGRTVVESITKVTSVDLVADPATTSGFFESIHPDEEGDVMSIDSLTLEQLDSSKPDLVTAIIERHNQSEAGKAKDAEIKKLKEHVDAFEAKEKLAARKATVDAKLAEAKLPKELLTDIFTEQCYEAADDAKLTKLIEDRQSLVKAIKLAPGTSRPQSKDQNVTEGAEEFRPFRRKAN